MIPIGRLGRAITLNSSVLLTVLKASADLTDAEIPPPSAEVAAPADFLLLLPVLLILIGAVLGGLRALLQSPVRSKLVEGLDDSVEKRIEQALLRHPSLPAALGLARLFLIVGAAVYLLHGMAGLDSLQRWPLGLVCALLGGLLLEIFPALVQRQRARRLVLSLLPMAVALATLLRPLTYLFERLLNMLGADPNGNGPETLTSELMDVAAEHEREEELGEAEKRMIGRVIDLPDADAASTMTPRTELTAVRL